MVDVDTLYDLWGICREYIPAKDRASAADHIINDLMDSGMDDKELKEFYTKDSLLNDAAEAYGLDNWNDPYEDEDEE